MFTRGARKFFSIPCPRSVPWTSLGVHYANRPFRPPNAHDHRRKMSLDRLRSRSVGFLERDGETWSCFLVTFRDEDLRWHGYFSFRPKDGGNGDSEIRTADIFIESSESEIDQKARGLGRPLLSGLLSSALHTFEQSEVASPVLRRHFRQLLAENSRELAGDWESDNDGDIDISRLRSLYASYRLDQVCHFIALTDSDHFEMAVDRILEGRRIDFRAKDQLQLSMIVVEYIENRLPIPPFEIWAEDYLSNRQAYHLYAFTLHREGRLP